MNKKVLFAAFFLLFGVTFLFFYKFFLFGKIPFPSDLLIAEYNPWSTYSYLGYNPGSFPNKGQFFDVLRQLYPWKTFAVEMLKNGTIPLWSPHNFSGTPLLANFQSAVFYPLNIFYFVFKQPLAWTILIILQPLLASFFTFLYARKIGISFWGSILSSVSFAFSGFMIVWLEYNTIGHVILYLPLLLFSVEKLLEKISIQGIILFFISAFFSLLAGHPQVYLFMLIFLFFYTGIRLCFLNCSTIKKKKLALFFLMLIILSIGSSGIQLFPGLELSFYSARSNYEYNFIIEKILIQPLQLIMLVVPDFFGNPATKNYFLSDTYIGKIASVGIVPLFFAVISLFKVRNLFFKIFTAVILITLLFTTVNPLTLIFYKIPTPFFSASSPTLGLFLLSFSLAILVGYGLDYWKKNLVSFISLVRFLSPLIGFFILAWIVFLLEPFLFPSDLKPFFNVSFRNLLLATSIFGVGFILILLGSFNHKLKFFILILFISMFIGEQWKAFQKFTPFSPETTIFPQTSLFSFLKEKNPDNARFWGYGTGFTEANIETAYGLFSPNGYDPLYIKRYGSFLYSSKDGKILNSFSRENRSDAVIAPGFGETDLINNNYRLRIMDFLGVSYILAKKDHTISEKTFPTPRFKKLYEEDNWLIFKNTKALPRAFFVYQSEKFKTDKEFEDKFFAENFDPLKTALMEKDINLSGKNSNSQDIAAFESYLPNKVVLKTQTKSDAILILSDNYYPGWRAFVDGKETPLYRAYYSFRAVSVPKGKHTVIFNYDPFSFRLGLYVSTASILGLIFLIIKVSRKTFLYN